MLELSIQLRHPGFELALEAALAERATAIVGPSGAGKSSLLEAIAGLRRASGRVVLDGQVLQDLARGIWLPPERRRIGYVPQEGLLFPHLSVEGNIRFGAHRSDPAEAIALFELGPLLGRMPATLSGGERQRVALARAVASAPRLLLLDEPLSAVDPARRERILPYLLRLRDEAGIPLLYVTHQWAEARVLATEVLRIEAGRLIARGSPDALLADPRATAGVAFDNVLSGRVVELGVDHASVLVGGLRVQVPWSEGLAPGAPASFLLSPDEVILAGAPASAISARNAFEGTVSEIRPEPHGALVRVEVEGVSVFARVTMASVSSLGLAAGKTVWVWVKTQALRRT